MRCDYVINEGAGLAIEFDGRRFYTLALGEKGVFRFNLRTHGVAGHASIPGVGDNALLKLAPLLERLREQPPHEATPDTELFLERLLGEAPPDLDEALDQDPRRRPAARDPARRADARRHPHPDQGAAPPTRTTSSPRSAEVLVDCRVPPGIGEDEVRERVAAVLGEGEYEIEFVENVVGNRSDYDGPARRGDRGLGRRDRAGCRASCRW